MEGNQILSVRIAWSSFWSTQQRVNRTMGEYSATELESGRQGS